MSELVFKPALELGRLLKKKKLSAMELLGECLTQYARHNDAINAVILTDLSRGRAAARAADKRLAAGEALSPFDGVPMTAKESFDMKGLPSTWGDPRFRDNIADADAVAVTRLTEAGAVIYGKTNVPLMLADWQSYNVIYGTTNNPWDVTRVPGGSSGGAATALAAGLTGLEIGSDIGASIRNPAHYCGVYGHKPTYEICSGKGHRLPPFITGSDISVIGPLARSAADLELALGLIAGADEPHARAWQLKLPAPDRVRLSDYRIAVKTGDREFPVDEATHRTALAVAETLRGAGATVTIDPLLPIPSRDYYELHLALARGSTAARRQAAEIAALQAEAAAIDRDDHGYHALMLRGLTQSHREWLERHIERQRLRLGWERFFKDYDVLIAPVSATSAFPHMQSVPKQEQRVIVDGTPRPVSDTYFWIGLASVAYLPATTIPAGSKDTGLPIGLQIIGPEYADRRCIALAQVLETMHRPFVPPQGYR